MGVLLQSLNPPVSRCRLQHTPVSKICQNPRKSGLFVGQIFLTLNFCLGLYSSSLGSAMVSTDLTTSLASGGSGHQHFCCFLTKTLVPPQKMKNLSFTSAMCFLSCPVLLHRCVTLSSHFPGLKNSMQTVNKSKKGITSHHHTHHHWYSSRVAFRPNLERTSAIIPVDVAHVHWRLRRPFDAGKYCLTVTE